MSGANKNLTKSTAMQQPPRQKVNQLVEHLFRHQAGQMVATLTRFFGIEHLDMVEDVVQETLLKALQQWVFRGVPENPSGWILQSARNRAIDLLRREKIFRDKEEAIRYKIQTELAPSDDEYDILLRGEFRDDQLRMIFTCCHPALPREARIALTLKTLCGLSVPEIARAFLAQESAVAQRLVRAKRKVRQEKIPFEVPDGSDGAGRLESVLQVLYLMFNEGYSAHRGENLIRDGLCEEAIRLTKLLTEHEVGKEPRVHALLALMFLQASRLPARVDDDGNLLRLIDQDRSLWDQELIRAGLAHLQQSAGGAELSEYHLQAGIAACHAVAGSFAETNWERILMYYDDLTELSHSPVVALNRAVALSIVEGPRAGLAELDLLSALPALKSYYLLPCCYAEFWSQLGEPTKARGFYEEALKLVGTEPERRFLDSRLALLNSTSEDKATPHPN